MARTAAQARARQTASPAATVLEASATSARRGCAMAAATAPPWPKPSRISGACAAAARAATATE
eukprot:3994523-Alexandrium_andersonii.AAC.1